MALNVKHPVRTFQFVHNMLDMEFASDGQPGSVVVAGHSQGAALALYASATYWRRPWGGRCNSQISRQPSELKQMRNDPISSKCMKES